MNEWFQHVRQDIALQVGKASPLGTFILSTDIPIPSLVEYEERWHSALIGNTNWGRFQCVLCFAKTLDIDNDKKARLAQAYSISLDIVRDLHESTAKYLAYLQVSERFPDFSPEKGYLVKHIEMDRQRVPFFKDLIELLGDPLYTDKRTKDFLYSLAKICLNVDILERLDTTDRGCEVLYVFQSNKFLNDYQFSEWWKTILYSVPTDPDKWPQADESDINYSRFFLEMEKLVEQSLGDKKKSMRLIPFPDYQIKYQVENNFSVTPSSKASIHLFTQLASAFEYCYTGNAISTFLQKKNTSFSTSTIPGKIPQTSPKMFSFTNVQSIFDPAFRTIISPKIMNTDWGETTALEYLKYLIKDNNKHPFIITPFTFQDQLPGSLKIFFSSSKLSSNVLAINCAHHVIADEDEMFDFFNQNIFFKQTCVLLTPDYYVCDWVNLSFKKWHRIEIVSEFHLDFKKQNSYYWLTRKRRDLFEKKYISDQIYGLVIFNNSNIIQLCRVPAYVIELALKFKDKGYEDYLNFTYIPENLYKLDNPHLFASILAVFDIAYLLDWLPPSFNKELKNETRNT